MKSIDFIKDVFDAYTDLSSSTNGSKISLICRENGNHADLTVEQIGSKFAWSFEGRHGKVDDSEEQTYTLTQKIEYFLEFGEW